MEVHVDALAEFILDIEQPVKITTLAKRAVRAWLERSGRQRRYAPGTTYEVGDTLVFKGESATVVQAIKGHNPVQGQFQIVTLSLKNGRERHMAAGVKGADSDEYIDVSDDDVERVLAEGGLPIRHAVQEALMQDDRFVWVPDEQMGQWYLSDCLMDVSIGMIAQVADLLDEIQADTDIPKPLSTDALVEELWNVENDGSNTYRVRAFSLEARLQRFQEFEHFPGEGWLLASDWHDFTERQELKSPRQPNVVPPATIEVDDSNEEDSVDQSDDEVVAEKAPLPEDFIAWHENRLLNAQFTLYAKHYYNAWLPLSKAMRRVFPPKKSQVTFYHRFGDEEASFPAIVDREQRKIFGGKTMYDAFYNNAIYPGAKLVISHRGNLHEYDIRTKPVEDGQEIRVRRLELLADGTLEDVIEREPMRYEVDKYVVVGEVRWEDIRALFDQADQIGVGIFTLMYNRCMQWEEVRGAPLYVKADELYDAIHFDIEEGRPTAIASINWELSRRRAFEYKHNGEYEFHPKFGDRLRVQYAGFGSDIAADATSGHFFVTKDKSLKRAPLTFRDAIKRYLDDSERPKHLHLRAVAHEKIRDLLAEHKLASLIMETFNREVWQLGQLRYNGREVRIGTEAANQLIRQFSFDELRLAIKTGKLEVSGNQTWGSATYIFGTQLTGTRQHKLDILQDTLHFLLCSRKPAILERLQIVLDEPNGLGVNTVSGVLHAMFPEEHILYNTRSVTAVKKLGYEWPNSWHRRADIYDRYREYALMLQRRYPFESLTDVDWFMYQVATDQIAIMENSSDFDDEFSSYSMQPRLKEASAYFILQQDPNSEYNDKEGQVYNWREGLPGSKQIVEGASFVYYQPGKKVFFGVGRIDHISSYVKSDGKRYYNGHIENYEPWFPPLALTESLGEALSFIDPKQRLWVGQAGIRKITESDFNTLTSSYETFRNSIEMK